ncbi:hypothetical protein KDI_10460 [Dictyobacter arantiisoli]|uniref:Uncharacterized protein n=1 Tax=Dictyobacter arantiisoli TaxID=2014874 RepID=A0A5A5T7W0_9CHLR|nr:hypothetical protein KDI_10460 [Dictyobacter arantiisoli]
MVHIFMYLLYGTGFANLHMMITVSFYKRILNHAYVEFIPILSITAIFLLYPTVMDSRKYQ